MSFGGGGSLSEFNHPHTESAAPSPSPQNNSSFQIVDDVPSIHSGEDDVISQVSQMEIPHAPRDLPITMTPPHTPPTSIAQVSLPGLEEGNRKLLSKLGGYGWRG